MRAARWFVAEKVHRQISLSPDPVFSMAIAVGGKNLPKKPRNWTRMKQPFRHRLARICSLVRTLIQSNI